MSQVEEIIANIASLSQEERETIFLVLADQQRQEAERISERFSPSQRSAIDQELLNRVDGPFIPLDSKEDRDAFWADIYQSVNQQLGYDLFEDA